MYINLYRMVLNGSISKKEFDDLLTAIRNDIIHAVDDDLKEQYESEIDGLRKKAEEARSQLSYKNDQSEAYRKFFLDMIDNPTSLKIINPKLYEVVSDLVSSGRTRVEIAKAIRSEYKVSIPDAVGLTNSLRFHLTNGPLRA
jgi:hypothetical protein